MHKVQHLGKCRYVPPQDKFQYQPAFPVYRCVSFTTRWHLHSTISALNIPTFLSPSEGQGAPISPSTPTTTSTSKLSPSPHPVTTSANQGTWPRLMPLLILTHPPEQRWEGLPQTASAPPAAPMRVAATGRSSSGWTSTHSLWVAQRAGRARRSNECEWTAGWHRAYSHVTTQHQGKHRKDTVMQMKSGF